MSFLSIRYPQQFFIREVCYNHNSVEKHGEKIEESEEGALIFEGFKLHYELIKQKRSDENVFDDIYIHRMLDSLRVLEDQEFMNGYHKTVYYDYHGKEHDYVTHLRSKTSPVEILLFAKCYRKPDYKLVEEIMKTAQIDEKLLTHASQSNSWYN